MYNKSLWELTQEAWRTLLARYEPVVEPMIESSGLESRVWSLLIAALTFEPENISPSYLMVRGPYTSADEYVRRLSAAADQGYLEEVAAAEFRLTAHGRREIERFIQAVRKEMEAADPLEDQESEKLTGYFGRLVETCLKTPPPPQTWSIQLSYRLMPPVRPALPYIEQAISCLYAYRDDSHLAAWEHSNLSACALEVLTLLWMEEADSLESLVDHLTHRGHSEEVYLDALTELRGRELIAGGRSKLRLTSAGRAFRNQVELLTDQLFYAPWTCLSRKDKFEMERLLVRLWEGLKVGVASHQA